LRIGARPRTSRVGRSDVLLADLKSLRPRIGGVTRVWCFTAALAAVTTVVVLSVTRSMSHPLGGVRVSWWTLAVGSALAELLVLHVRIGRDARALSLSELPLVIGLAFSSPAAIVLAQALGLGVVVAMRRERPVRAAFQVALRAATTLAAVFVFASVVGAAGSSWPAIWLAVFAATIVADVAGAVLSNAAIALAESTRMRFEQIAGLGTALTLAKTAAALVAVMLLVQYPFALVLVVVPAAALVFAGRAYVDMQRKNEDLILLRGATRVAQRSLHPEDMLPQLLEHVRAVLHAGIAELVIPDDVPNQHLVSRVGPGDAVAILTPTSLDPTSGVWARVTAEREGVLLDRPIANAQLADHFGALGIADAIVSPVASEDGRVGVLMVANRVGGFSTFGRADLDLLDAIADEIGITIGNARVMQRVEEALARETETNKLKDDFLATISHELRSPLTSMQGYVKTMLGAGAGMSEKEREEFLAGADRAGERLRSLIEDLLFTSRVEATVASSRPGPVGLAGLVERVVEDRAEHVAPNRIVLRFPPSVPPVWTSEEGVRRIASNLLDNALKYSPADTSVTVSAQTDGDGVLISFHDRGPGIPEGERERIFERFYQVDRGLTRSNGGVGLGLHICRRTAESLGGRVWLDRSDESGSVFCLWLPSGGIVSVDDLDERRTGRIGAFVGQASM
jgi:signal transduction histidine kinase